MLRFNDHPHRFVFLFGLLFGGSLVFLSPPYSSPDEVAHFHRAYHCAEGKLYAKRIGNQTGDDLPCSLTDTYEVIVGPATSEEDFEITWAKFNRAAGIPLDPQRRQFTAFSNTALYSPVAYLPQSLAMWLGHFWKLPPLGLLYLARIVNLIVYLLLATAAVRLTPIHKWTLALAAMIPMSVYLAASLSADAMTLGLSLLAVAFVLHIALGNGKPDPGQMLLFGILLALLTLAKQAYFGLVLLFFVIPGEKFSSPGRRWLTAALVVGGPLAIEAAWAWSLRGLYVPMLPFVDPPAQLRSILVHPWSYMATMFKAIWKQEDHSLMIGFFGWLGPRLPRWIRITYWAALGLTAVLDGGKRIELGLRAKAVLFGVYVITAAAMVTMIYLSWERVGMTSIGGMQPRYFLPILPLVLLPLRGDAAIASSQLSRTAVPIIAMAVITLAAGATWWTMVMRYYW